MTYYILDGKVPVPEPDIKKWAKWYAKTNRIVKKDIFIFPGIHKEQDKKITVSTVFLGTNHSIKKGEVLLFETMVFGGSTFDDEICKQCATWDEAEKQHEKVCELIKKLRKNNF